MLFEAASFPNIWKEISGKREFKIGWKRKWAEERDASFSLLEQTKRLLTVFSVPWGYECW
jgi:hypothetical protein